MRKSSTLIVVLSLLIGCGCNTDKSGPLAPELSQQVIEDLPQQARDLLQNPPADPGNPEYAGWPMYPDSLWDAYIVRIVWGQLHNETAPGSVSTDWSGLLRVELAEAFVRVRAEINWEREDSVLVHDAVHFAAWLSHTHGDFDGLEFVICVRKGPLTVIPQLSFHTQPFSTTIGFDKLSDLDTVFNVDNVSSVAVHSRKIMPPECPYGGLHGRWVFKTRQQGFFEGKWMDAHGFRSGYLAGVFWTSADGERQFTGFWFDPIGINLGRLWGSWEYNNDTSPSLTSNWPHGRFRGLFSDRNDHVLGGLHGEFGPPSADAANTVLAFRGRWSLHCSAGAVLTDLH